MKYKYKTYAITTHCFLCTYVCLSAFSDEFCRGYPHNLIVTPGYWVECSGQTAQDEVSWTLGEESDQTEQLSSEQDDSSAVRPTRSKNKNSWRGRLLGFGTIWILIGLKLALKS